MKVMSDASKYQGRCFIAINKPNMALIAFKKAIDNDEKNAELYSMLFKIRLLWTMLLNNGIMGRCIKIL